jgi:hypothetical protein
MVLEKIALVKSSCRSEQKCDAVMKRANTYKGKLGWQSEFSHRYACWANNHNGWAKAKKSNKRLAKRRLRAELRKELVYSISDK